MEIIWSPIPGWEGYYEANNIGLIKSVERIYYCKQTAMITTDGILRPKLDVGCYLQVSLNREGRQTSYQINQLIALTFIDNPNNKPFTDHINGVRWDNRVENLRWVTQSENIKSAFDLGRKKVASKPINCYTLDGVFIKKYEAIRHVELDGFNSKYVNEVVKNKKKIAYNHIWEYSNPNQI